MTVERLAPNQVCVSAKAAVVHDGRILLVAYEDAWGPHYNLPGGGVRPGESLREAAEREVLEETGYSVDVGRMILVVEYIPSRWRDEFGSQQKVQFQFRCSLRDMSAEPSRRASTDPAQRAAKWIPIEELPSVTLLPRIGDRLLASLQGDSLDTVPDTLIDSW